MIYIIYFLQENQETLHHFIFLIFNLKHWKGHSPTSCTTNINARTYFRNIASDSYTPGWHSNMFQSLEMVRCHNELETVSSLIVSFKSLRNGGNSVLELSQNSAL